jgi:GNAT superfamily N-acetyltransferase
MITVSEGSRIPDVEMAGDLPTPDVMAPEAENPDARIFLADHHGGVVAHAALWWRDTPMREGRRLGAIGGFAAATPGAARELLDAAADRLRAAACRVAVGPMNGNTWRRHRFVMESDGRAPFLLEPQNPPESPGWWKLAGFGLLSAYSSSVMALDGVPALPEAVRVRLEKAGVVVRKLDLSNYEDELRVIHRISLKSFSNNFLYTPLGEEEFVRVYQKVRPLTDPDFVRIAEKAGVPCGFVFGIPDLGRKPALIVKTLAVDPASRCAGLGSLLVDELHRAGESKGLSEAIHALQHESNSSLKITGRHRGHAFRRYGLFARFL